MGEGMIPTESRMPENGTSGLTSGGEETRLGARLRHRRVAKAAGNRRLPRSTAGAPPLDSTQVAPVLLETVCIQYVMGPLRESQEKQSVLGMPWLVFFLQRAHAPSTVETATLFGREHALEKKILRHDHAPW